MQKTAAEIQHVHKAGLLLLAKSCWLSPPPWNMVQVRQWEAQAQLSHGILSTKQNALKLSLAVVS
jgi:hypothetical protein